MVWIASRAGSNRGAQNFVSPDLSALINQWWIVNCLLNLTILEEFTVAPAVEESRDRGHRVAAAGSSQLSPESPSEDFNRHSYDRRWNYEKYTISSLHFYYARPGCVCAYTPSTWEAEVGQSQVQSHPGPYGKLFSATD